MTTGRKSVVVAAVLLVAAGASFLLRSGRHTDLAARNTMSMDPPSGSESASGPAINDTSPSSRPASGEDTRKRETDCTPLEAAEREHLESVARDWYGELGDAAARRYWPYANVDNETLRRAADAGDAEAMFQFGMNMLWKATRTTGEHWQPQGTRLHETIPARDHADLETFKLADTYLVYAVAHGKIFAYREMAAAHVRYPALFQKMLHRDDAQAQQELVNVVIAAWEMLPNYLVPGLPRETVRVELTARARERAVRLAEGQLLTIDFVRNEDALLPPDIDVPHAVLQLSDDDRCTGGNFRQSFGDD